MDNDKYMSILARDNFSCQQCGKNQNETRLSLAHRIRKGSGSEKWAHEFIFKETGKSLSFKFIREEILNHPDNLVTACVGDCNDAQNIFFNPVERDRLLLQIIEKVLK